MISYPVSSDFLGVVHVVHRHVEPGPPGRTAIASTVSSAARPQVSGLAWHAFEQRQVTRQEEPRQGSDSLLLGRDRDLDALAHLQLRLVGLTAN